MAGKNISESIADLWKAIASNYRPGVFVFELRMFSELENTPSIFKAIFEFMDGYFVDHLNPIGIIDFREKCDFEYAESYSRKLGLGRRKGFRGFRYKQEEYESKTQVVSYLVDYENEDDNSAVINEKRVVDLNQSSTSLLASALASPIIGRNLRKPILGLLFKEHLIDYTNLETLFRFFAEIKKQENYEEMEIYLIVVSERLGRNVVYYNDHIQRIGIVKDVFIKVNPYEACVKRIETISGGVVKERPFVFFLGAGASAESETKSGALLPSGDDLKKIAIKSILNKPELKNANIEELEEKFRNWLYSSGNLITERGETRENVVVTLERVLREELSLVHPSNSKTLEILRDMCDEAQPPRSYADIKRMIEIGYRPILITTNYDMMLERILGDSAVYCSLGDFAGKQSDIISYIKNEKPTKIPILKIHGSLKNPESIKHSVNSTYKLQEAIHELMHSIYVGDINSQIGNINTQTFFSGYSFRDQDVHGFFSYSEVFNKMKPYIVNPSPSTDIMDFLLDNGIPKQEYFNTLISLPFSIFTRSLLDQLEKSRVES